MIVLVDDPELGVGNGDACAGRLTDWTSPFTALISVQLNRGPILIASH